MACPGTWYFCRAWRPKNGPGWPEAGAQCVGQMVGWNVFGRGYRTCTVCRRTVLAEPIPAGQSR